MAPKISAPCSTLRAAYLAKPFEGQDLARLLAHWSGDDKDGREEAGAGAT